MNQVQVQPFQEGQEVEVARCLAMDITKTIWRKAKIVCNPNSHLDYGIYPKDWWQVQFPDGTRGVFDVEHIRIV
jgi:hypothetical protein